MFGLFAESSVKAIESVAKEWIETDTEKAEAKAVMIKTLDPNGLMRRDISNKVSSLYIVYIVVTMILLLCSSFEVGNVEQLDKAINHLTELFIPITSMFTMIVGASFGVNVSNNFKKNKD